MSTVIAIPGWGDGETPPPRNLAPLIVAALMLGFAWIAIILRLYTRIFLVLAFGWDDIFMILSLACFSVYSGGLLDITAIDSLLDQMSYPDLVSAVKGILLVLIFYVATITFLKLSLGIFLIRIINYKSHRIIVYVVLVISTVWGVVAMLVAVFQCGYPSSAEYYISQRLSGKCISGETAVAAAYTHAVISASSDVIFTVLPLFILREAQINRRAKIVLGVILMLGAIGSVASLVRFPYIRDLKVVTTHFFLQNASLSIWSSLECGLGISAGSLATLRPMFRKLLQGARNIASRTRETVSGDSNRQNTNGAALSKKKSFASRFSLSSKRATIMSRYIGDTADIETFSSSPLPTEGISEKPYESVNSAVKAVSVSRDNGMSSRERASHERRREADMSKDIPLETVTESYGPDRAYAPRRGSHHSSRYSQSDQSREETWI